MIAQENRLWWLLGLYTLLRLAYAVWFPLDLSGDETYYWDWGRHPDFGYYSKPPLIGWLMAALRVMGLDSPLGMRSFTTLASSLGLLLFYLLGRRIVGRDDALWATLLLALAPVAAALGLVLTIDLPLLLCWIAALYAFHRWCEAPGRHRAWGLALIPLVGLGLLSKQTMATFLLLSLVYLAWNPATRPWLRRPQPWLASLAALCFLLPTLWWNWRHDWITLRHTLAYLDPDGLSFTQSLASLAGLLGADAAVLGPVTWGLLSAAVLSTLIRHRGLPPDQRFLFVFGGLPLLLSAFLALFVKVQPNWPAPFFITALLQTVVWVRGGPRPGIARRWLRSALAVSLACSALTYAAPLLPLQQGWSGREVDVLHRLRGWQTGADRVQALRHGHFGDRPHWLLVHGHRFFVSQLAFHLPDRPRVHRWPWLPGRVESQYEIWGGPRSAAGAALVVSAAENRQPALPAGLRAAFQSLTPLGGLTQTIGATRKRYYRLYLAEGWRGIKQTAGSHSR